MTLEDVYTISQILAALVVTATLIAILVQTDQTNRIARADLTLNMWMKTGEMQHSLIDTPEKADFMYRALNETAPLTEAERLRFTFAFTVALGTHEAAHHLLTRKLVEAAAYDRVEAVTRLYMRSPVMRNAWARTRDRGFAPAFRDVVDGIVREIEAKGASRAAQGAP